MDTFEVETPEQRLARYAPTTLSAGLWTLARDPATAAVLAACPVSAEDAKGLVSRLCQLLAGHPGWDRRAVPDLTVLVTDLAIAAHLARLAGAGKSAKTRENHRADLRRVARALAGTARPPSALNARGTSTSTAPAGRVPTASQRLLDWLTAGVAPLVAVAAWEDSTGRKASRDLLDPVVKAVVAHRATNATGSAAGMVGLFVPVGTPVWGEVSPRTWPRSAPNPAGTAAATPTRVGPPSRAATLRAAKATLEAHAAPTVAPAPDVSALPEPVRAAITGYRPEGLTAERWQQLAPLCRRLMAGYSPPSATSARAAGTILSAFLDWATDRPGRAQRGGELTAAELRTVGLADAYLHQLTSPDSSMATYRSVLRRALRSLDPAPARPIAYQPVAGPYTGAECAAFVRLARNQPTNPRRRELSVIVGLGLGAGLDGRGLKALRAADITEVTQPDGSTVLVVTVGGDRPRTVPVRTAYAALVQEALTLHRAEGRGANAALLGQKTGRRNVTTPALAHAVTATEDGVDIAVNRLRATWLVACLAAGVPLGALLHAAGLRSARTLTDLLPYCPAPDHAAVTALLAGVADPAAIVPITSVSAPPSATVGGAR